MKSATAQSVTKSVTAQSVKAGCGHLMKSATGQSVKAGWWVPVIKLMIAHSVKDYVLPQSWIGFAA